MKEAISSCLHSSGCIHLVPPPVQSTGPDPVFALEMAELRGIVRLRDCMRNDLPKKKCVFLGCSPGQNY